MIGLITCVLGLSCLWVPPESFAVRASFLAGGSSPWASLHCYFPPQHNSTCTLKFHCVNSRHCLLISYKEIIMEIQRSSWFQLLGLNHLLAVITPGFPSLGFSHTTALQRKDIKCCSVLMINCSIVECSCWLFLSCSELHVTLPAN